MKYICTNCLKLVTKDQVEKKGCKFAGSMEVVCKLCMDLVRLGKHPLQEK